MEPEKDLVTLADAAARLGVAPATLRAQVHRGKLMATKLGRDWLVTRAEIQRYERESLREKLR